MLDQVSGLSLSLTPENIFLLLILVALEAVLSADNAVALAAITQSLENPEDQRKALNIGLVLAYVLRITLIVIATWIIDFWQFQLLGALYLLWLVFNYFQSPKNEDGTHKRFGAKSLWQVIPMIGLTDLAFSLDSVTAAIAVADETWLVIAGGTLGVITLRFLAGLFIKWLDEYTHLEDAGFVTVGFVGLRLLVRVINEDWVPPEWLMVSAIILMFVWGFSERTPQEEQK